MADLFDIAIARKLSDGGGGGGGSSDFSTAEVTIVGGSVNTCMPVCLDFSGQGMPFDYVLDSASTTESEGVYQVPLYKGNLITTITAVGNISLSGDIIDMGENLYNITGDCTITIS